jgi:hypothetical protein
VNFRSLSNHRGARGFRRARWRSKAGGRWGTLEVHHVVKRAPGGPDFDLDRLVALCPPCHTQTDAPYTRGRLVISPLRAGRFTIEVQYSAMLRRLDPTATRAPRLPAPRSMPTP